MIMELKDGSLKANINYNKTSIILQLTDSDGSQTRVLLSDKNANDLAIHLKYFARMITGEENA